MYLIHTRSMGAILTYMQAAVTAGRLVLTPTMLALLRIGPVEPTMLVVVEVEAMVIRLVACEYSSNLLHALMPASHFAPMFAHPVHERIRFSALTCEQLQPDRPFCS